MKKNNLELRIEGNIFTIVKWQPNSLYQKEHEYDKVGSYYISKDNFFRVHEGCFLHTETCCVISTIENGIVKFVGNRPIELETIQEMRDYLFVMRSGIKKSLRYK